MFSDFIKTIPQYLLPQKHLTTFAGLVAGVTNPAIKNYIIQRFIAQYQVNMTEALQEDPKAYNSFNDFFIRQLKPGCRPLAEADIVSPVDGCISELGAIEKGQLLQAKGRYYTVQELLGCSSEQAALFEQGKFATIYLSPKDYHRVHMPIEGTLLSMNYIPGALFSVQPRTARVVPNLFARNERLAVFFDTKVGPMAMVMVGAIIVGAIGTSWHGALKRTKKQVEFDYRQSSMPNLWPQAAEMGYFKLGSTVVLLFANGKQIQWNPTLKAGQTLSFGMAMGESYS